MKNYTESRNTVKDYTSLPAKPGNGSIIFSYPSGKAWFATGGKWHPLLHAPGGGGGGSYDDTQVKADIATNAAAIVLNTAKVSYTDAAKVTKNIADIATNVTGIATNATDIATLKKVGHYHGTYATTAARDAAVTTPKKGDYVLVGTAAPYIEWIYDTAWKQAGTTGSSTGVAVVNDLTTGGTTSALSAEQGKVLAAKTNLISGTTAINFDEVLLDGDKATISDLEDHNPGPQELARVVTNAGFRHVMLAGMATTMNDKGSITDVAAITKTGIYYGGSIDATHTTVDVTNSPVQGPIMVMASKDGHGNFGYFLMGMDEILHTGGKQSGGTAIKWNKIFDSSDLGDIHTFVAGSDLATKLMELKTQVDKASHSTSTNKATVWAGSMPVDGAAGGFVMGYPDLFLANPANPGQDIKDGTEHYIKFTQKDHPSTSPSWIWLTERGKTKRLWTNDAKTTAVDGLSMGVYIKKGAYIKVVKLADEWYVKDVIIPALPQGTTKAILNDGSVKMDSGYVASADEDVATVKTIREFRATVIHDIADHAKPTIAECKAAFKLLPHFDWKKDDNFYIKDSSGGKLVLIKYRGTPAATEAAPGVFFYEVLTKAK